MQWRPELTKIELQLSGEFEDPHLQEAVRIISMRLRIKSYSKSEVPGYAHLPTIHFVGETTGATMHGQPRSLHGTVSVIGDGSVRWVLVSPVLLLLSTSLSPLTTVCALSIRRWRAAIWTSGCRRAFRLAGSRPR